MNKAITDGVVLTPPPFASGLNVYSSGDGTPGSDTYAGAANAQIAFADQDFGDCLELQKTSGITRVRHMGETPLLPGCYLRVTARVKAISGNLPNVRIAAYAGGPGGNPVGGVATTGLSTTLTAYGDVVEVSAIVGAGNRGGVDMVWGASALYGHFGIDLTGPNGGIVRIDDFEIEDITSAFLRDIVSVVDVRDYGALGNGVTDDSPAFDRANAAAAGRTILIPEGTFRLNSDVTLDHPVRFEGTVSMPDSAILLIRRNFDLPTYIEAFEDETTAFKKAFQALLNNSDHESLDMCGRRIALTEPVDMQAAVNNRTSYATRRVIRNGQIEAQGTTGWTTEVTTSLGTYDTSNPTQLTNVTNVANIKVGSVIQGSGVGREIYVRSKNVSQQTIRLNGPLYDAAGTQNFTFRRFKYILDFSGFSSLTKFELDSIEFQANNRASCILLAETGLTFTLRDCWLSRPKDRAVSSHGGGCQGMIIDRCQFLSSEDALPVADRVSVGFNVNANDAKIRNCRATRFRHFGLLAGSNNLIIGNHFFQGDAVANGVRTAGLIIAKGNTASVISGNYIDNCFIEWTNEQDPTPNFTSGFSFSALSLTDNVFLSGDVAPWFSYLVVKPHGTGHFIAGLSVAGNKFRSINGGIDRVERVDTSFADLNYARMKDVEFHGNSFHSVTYQVSNPLRVEHSENSPTATWTVDTDRRLPFESYAVSVESVVPSDRIRNSANQTRSYLPYAQTRQGADQDQVNLVWQEAVRGRVQMVIRMDD
ncbi:MAG: right-handed parallel beta-helix repeat-containing protein [Pseudomonadota bacterium]